MSLESITTKIKVKNYSEFSRNLLVNFHDFMYIVKMNEHSLIFFLLV